MPAALAAPQIVALTVCDAAAAAAAAIPFLELLMIPNENKNIGSVNHKIRKPWPDAQIIPDQ